MEWYSYIVCTKLRQKNIPDYILMFWISAYFDLISIVSYYLFSRFWWKCRFSWQKWSHYIVLSFKAFEISTINYFSFAWFHCSLLYHFKFQRRMTAVTSKMECFVITVNGITISQRGWWDNSFTWCSSPRSVVINRLVQDTSYREQGKLKKSLAWNFFSVFKKASSNFYQLQLNHYVKIWLL